MTDVFLKGDMVLAVDGPNAGKGGRVICSFRNWLTILRDDGTAFDIPAANVRPMEPERGQHEND